MSKATIKRAIIQIERLDDAELVSEFEKLLLRGAGETSVPLSWFRTEIKKRMNKNGKKH